MVAAVPLGVPFGTIAAIDASQEIPGAAWPGGVVTSNVGGPIFDRVWKLDLPQGRVAVIRLTGEAGAELGLYLFSGSATSVTSDTPLASSAVAGGRQSIVRGLAQGSYYINVNGRNVDRAYRFLISVSLAPDLTPPTVRPATGTKSNRVSGDTVELLPNAVDSVSGIDAIRARKQGEPWGEWQFAVDRIVVPLPLGEGAVSFEVQARNGLGMESEVGTLELFVDRTAPTVSAVGSAATGIVTDPRPRISYEFNEPMDAMSTRNALLLVDSYGSRVAGRATYDTTTNRVTFVPDAPLKIGSGYIVDLVGATDVAGNVGSAASGWSFSYLSKTGIRAAVTSSTIAFGSSLEIRGTTEGVPKGAVLSIQWRESSAGAWTEIGRKLSNGPLFTVRAAPLGTGAIRVSFAGDLTRAPSTSRALQVTVRPALTLVGAGPGVATAKRGATIQLSGSVSPSYETVSLLAYKCNSLFKQCTLASETALVPDADGRILQTIVARKGHWVYRLSVDAQGAVASGVSARYRLDVP